MITIDHNDSAENTFEQRIRELENSNHLIAKMDLHTRFLYLSPVLEKKLGLTPDMVPRKKGRDFIYPEDRKKISSISRQYKRILKKIQIFAAPTEKTIIFSDLIQLRIKNGLDTPYWLETIFTIINYTIFAISTDITAQNKIQAARSLSGEQPRCGIPGENNTEWTVIEEKDKLRILMESLNCLGIGINIVGCNHDVQFQNKVLDEKFGEIDNNPCYVRYQEETTPCAYCPFTQSILQDKPFSKIIRAKNGNDYEVMSVPLHTADQTVSRALGLFINITKEKTGVRKWRFESRLMKEEKLESIGILAGGVAHDLNNILSALVGYPDLLLKELPGNSYLRELIIAIKDSGVKAAAIVQDLLTLSRQGLEHTEIVNLNTIIADYFKSLQYNKVKSFNSGIEFKTSLADNLFNITGSSIHLLKALINLINNAVDAIERSGVIFLSTYNMHIDTMLICYENIQAGDYAVLKVSDTGMGIDQEDMDRIFEPFYTKKLINKFGTGLGLAVVRSTVKDHKGYIDVRSLPGKGTVFELFFPVTNRKITPGTMELNLEKYMGSGEKILVVDDMKEQRDITSRILSHLGYFVVAISNGEEAVEYLKKYPMDIVMIDMIMESGMDGLDTYMEIIKFNPEQKVIIISGYAETERVKKAQTLGVVGYIKKPYTIAILGTVVKNCLQKKIMHNHSEPD